MCNGDTESSLADKSLEKHIIVIVAKEMRRREIFWMKTQATAADDEEEESKNNHINFNLNLSQLSHTVVLNERPEHL